MADSSSRKTIRAALNEGEKPVSESSNESGAEMEAEVARLREALERAWSVLDAEHGHTVETLADMKALPNECKPCEGMGHDLGYTDAPVCENCLGSGTEPEHGDRSPCEHCDVAKLKEQTSLRMQYEDQLSDLMIGFNLWKESKLGDMKWSNEDEAFLRWVEASQ